MKNRKPARSAYLSIAKREKCSHCGKVHSDWVKTCLHYLLGH